MLKHIVTNWTAIGAIALLTGCGSQSQPEAETSLTTGLRLARKGAHAKARDALIAATDSHADSVTAHYNLGLVYWKLGHAPAAVASLSKAVALAEGDTRPTAMLARILIDTGNIKGARKVLRDVDTPTASTLTTAALAMYKSQKHDLARSCLGQALELNSDYPPALYNLAVLYRDVYENPREALAHYKHFQTVAPQHFRAAESPQAFLNLRTDASGSSSASSDASRGSPESQPPTHTPAPPPPGVREALTKANDAIARGNSDTALLTLKTAVKDYPDNAGALWALINLYDEHLGLTNRAAALAQQFQERFPDDIHGGGTATDATTRRRAVTAYFEVGLKHYAADAWDQAIAAYQRALDVYPESASSAFNLGLSYKAKGDLARAAEAFAHAASLRPDMPKALYMLGLTDLQRGRNAAALAQFNRLLRVQPDFPKAHYLLATIYRDEGRPDMAVVHFERYLSFSPTGGTADDAQRWLEQHRDAEPE